VARHWQAVEPRRDLGGGRGDQCRRHCFSSAGASARALFVGVAWSSERGPTESLRFQEVRVQLWRKPFAVWFIQPPVPTF